MDIVPTKLDKAVVLTVIGRMDAENANAFKTACEKWINQGEKRLLADLTGLEYVSSMGLSSFLSVAKSLQSDGGSLTLCGLHGLPKQMFEMTRLIGLFPVFDSKEAALASLS